MVEQAHICFNAQDRSYFAILKKEIRNIAQTHGFSEKKTGEIDIVVAEITSNLLKHGGGGELLVKTGEENNNKFLEIISIDNGPGMHDVERMMEDGVSTVNTMGHGLGSIKRLSDEFHIYSQLKWGTILLSRFYQQPLSHHRKTASAEVRALVVCKPGETVSGDGYGVKKTSEYIQVMLGDGLGHGPDAHKAVDSAVKVFANTQEKDPVAIIREMHTGVKRTRGLVASLAAYFFKEKQWRICGVGNISTGMIQSPGIKNYVSYNGIIGLNIPNTMKAQEVKPEYGQFLIMCSDGIKTKNDIQKYPGILRHDLSLLAAAIYKDYARRTDDMSVLVCKIND